MTVAVTTPTGSVGRPLVAALLRAGVRPRVLVRDPRHLDSAVLEQVDVITVDLLDREAVVAATRGVSALYWVDPPTDGPDPVADHARCGATAAHAVAVNGIDRTVFQSSVGAEKRYGAGEIDGLARTEVALDRTGAPVLHLRCGYFFSNLLFQLAAIRDGVLPISVPVDHPMPWVAPVDIAQVAALRLIGPAWTGRQVQAVHGPADLTWAQVAALIGDVTGRAVRAEQVPDEDMRSMMAAGGMAQTRIDAMMGMSIGLRAGFLPEQPRTAISTTPTGLAGWIHATLVPALAR